MKLNQSCRAVLCGLLSLNLAGCSFAQEVVHDAYNGLVETMGGSPGQGDGAKPKPDNSQRGDPSASSTAMPSAPAPVSTKVTVRDQLLAVYSQTAKEGRAAQLAQDQLALDRKIQEILAHFATKTSAISSTAEPMPAKDENHTTPLHAAASVETPHTPDAAAFQTAPPVQEGTPVAVAPPSDPASAVPDHATPMPAPPSLEDRVRSLEERVRELEAILAQQAPVEAPTGASK